MYAYGDESGHLRNLLDGSCEVFVLAVVAGKQHDCIACPKQAVRRITDLDEARWTDLLEPQKRRVMDCLTDSTRELSYGYIVLRRPDLDSLDGSYLLHQDRAFDVEWDLGTIGHGYAHILERVADQALSSFTFDRLFGNAQSEAIRRVIQRPHLNTDVYHDVSHGTKGIQAADCLAGAVAESHRGGDDWLEELGDGATDLSDGFLTSLNRRLSNGDK